MPSPPPGPVFTLRGHGAGVTAARFAPWTDDSSEPMLLTAAADGELRIWSLRTRRPVARAAAHEHGAVLCVHGLPDGRVLSHGRDGFIRLWDSANGLSAPLLQLPVESTAFCPCAVAPGPAAASAPDEAQTAPLVATASADSQSALLWDLRQRTPARRLAPPTSAAYGRVGMCMHLRFAGAGTLLAGWEDGSLCAYDLRSANSGSETAPACSRKLHSEPVLAIDVDAACRAVVTGGADRAVRVVALRAADAGEGAASASAFGADVAELPIPVTNEASGAGGIASIRVRPDGKILASGGWDRRVRLWQWGGGKRGAKHKPLAVLREHTGTVHAVDFSACSRWLASASEDKTVALWGLYRD